MGKFNGNTKGGTFAASSRSSRKQAGAGLQILFSLLLLADLVLLYTIIMQMTHLQKAFEASDTVNLILLIALAVGAVALIYAVIRSGAWKRALCILLIFTVVYLAAVFSDIPVIDPSGNVNKSKPALQNAETEWKIESQIVDKKPLE